MARAVELAIAGLSLGGLYALIAFALSLVMSTTGVVNLAHGPFLVCGAAILVVLSLYLKLHMLLVFALIVVCFIIVGILFERGVVRSLLGKGPHHVTSGSILITFGLALAMEAALGASWATFIDPNPVFSFPLGLPPLELGGVSVSGSRLIVLLFVAAMALLFHVLLQKTMLGKAARAMAENFDGFLVVGLNPYRISTIVLTATLVVTAVAGAFYVFAVPLTAYDGLPITIKAFTIIILAGVGSLPGTLLAGAILGLAEVATSYIFGSIWAPAVSYVVLLLALVVRPTGLFGRAVP